MGKNNFNSHVLSAVLLIQSKNIYTYSEPATRENLKIYCIYIVYIGLLFSKRFQLNEETISPKKIPR